jgi:hypothetical protein
VEDGAMTFDELNGALDKYCEKRVCTECELLIRDAGPLGISSCWILELRERQYRRNYDKERS